MNGIHDEAPSVTAAPAKPIRPLYWSLRRELWEHRSLYLAPLLIAGILLFVVFVQMFTYAARVRALMDADPVKQYHALTRPYDTSAGMIMIAGVLVGIFYCLDALHGERRDRSMLFWKSLPVSDLTTVLSKFLIPFIVLPLIVWSVVVATQLIIIVMSTAVLQTNPAAVAKLWSTVQIHQRLIGALWALFAMALWHAPIYAWLLLVSGWAKHAAFLWAALPAFIVSILESGSRSPKIVPYRTIGWFREAFLVTKGNPPEPNPLASITPLHYFSTPGLWIGLLFAAALLAATVRMRRDREPI
jgi:ABC-2 type transport system permease protein